ncbi:hypothetical protein OIE62_04995 [Streptomyces scopuliridis]|uniref:Uncharacterized protein n=1 Tax=Streptomyces scopuliridis TaxID=452529 RepID=A0ACD4ZW20_9ACTN|nr:hypothetical protein [Streptomyces scopuliridis]WSC02022.1 hypothetical protein OG835_36835 [Streptomyces scopuliridis]WSC04441.1 hypothetical protein OIE62_04995 [Streptomyces scopuliridis]
MTHRPTDLSSFAAALAGRLPGPWISHYHQHSVYSEQFALGHTVWDLGHVHWAVSEFVLRHDAELSGPHGQRLYVIERPLKPGHHRLNDVVHTPAALRSESAEESRLRLAAQVTPAIEMWLTRSSAFARIAQAATPAAQAALPASAPGPALPAAPVQPPPADPGPHR